MADLNTSLLDNLSPISSVTVYAGSDLGTDPVKVVSGRAGKVFNNRLVKILNGSDSNRIGWQVVPAGAAAPSISANFEAGAGSLILSGSETEWLVIPKGCDLYLVASDANTEYCVSVVER